MMDRKIVAIVLIAMLFAILAYQNIFVSSNLSINETIKTVGAGKNYATVQTCYDSIPPIINGNITCLIDPGTYSESLLLGGKSANGNFYIRFKGATNTTLVDTTSTGGNAGSQTTQANVIKTGAGWTVDVYQGKWIWFTSGTNNGKIRIIENNTATQLNLVGALLPAAPGAGDTFKIIDNNVYVSGTSSVINPTSIETIFEQLNIGDMVMNSVSLYRFDRVRQNLTGYNNNKRSSSTGWHKDSVIQNINPVSGIWLFGGILTSDHNYYYNNVTPAVFEWGFLNQGGAHVLSRNGDMYKKLYYGLWTQIGGTAHADWTDSYGIEANTKLFIKENNYGLLAQAGSTILINPSMVVFSNNNFDYSPVGALDPSWIG